MSSNASLALALLAFAACSSYTFEQRSTFAETIGSPEALLHARDPRALSERLAKIQMPETDEHHAELLRVLRSVSEITTDRLLLLTNAVAPGEKALGSGTKITINGRRINTARAPRGTGPYAYVVDRLLQEGTTKLVDVNRFNAGRLIGRSESMEAMVQLSDRFLPRIDDGSPTALREILIGFDGSLPDATRTYSGSWGTTTITSTSNNAKSQFVTEILFPRGLAEGKREFVALEAISGTSRRLTVLQARLGLCKTIEPDRFEEYLELLSGNSSRLALLSEHAEKLEGMDHDDALDLTKTLSGSSSRLEILPKLVARVEEPLDLQAMRRYLKSVSGSSSRLQLLNNLGADLAYENAEDIRDTLKLYAGSSSRLQALKTILERSRLQLSGRDMRRLVAMFSGSSSRIEAIEVTERYVQRPIEASSAISLLKLFGGTSSKLEVLRKLERDYEALPRKDREYIVEQFPSSSSRKKAKKILGL